jgi:hypothetical protein
MSHRFPIHVRLSAILSAMALVPAVFALRCISSQRADRLERFGVTMLRNLVLDQWER